MCRLRAQQALILSPSTTEQNGAEFRAMAINHDNLLVMRTTMREWWVTLVLVLVCSIACADSQSVRLIAGTADTVVVHSLKPTQIFVHGLDAAGQAREVRDLRFEWLSGDRIPVSSDGHATCTKRADATMEVSRASLTTRFLVLCRPVSGFRLSAGLRLVAGGLPQQLPLLAVDEEGKSVSPIVGSVQPQDEGIVSLHGLAVYPQKVGETVIDVDVGDCRGWVDVVVADRARDPSALRPNQAFATRVSIRSGTSRKWFLTPGPYEIWLTQPDSNFEGSLLLTGRALNCARIIGEGLHYWCVALKGASVEVGNARQMSRGGMLSGDLFVLRQLDDLRDTLDARGARRASSSEVLYNKRVGATC